MALLNIPNLDGSHISEIGGASGPPLVEATGGADLMTFVTTHADRLRRTLDEHGALLLRGFARVDETAFRSAAAAMCNRLIDDYGDLPRSPLNGVYQATPYPAELDIHFHNEASHVKIAPSRQFFYCQTPAAEGGAWRIVDGRAVVERLPHSLLSSFSEGLRYERRFIPRMDVDWRDFLQTSDPAAIGQRAGRIGYSHRWVSAHNILEIFRVAPAMVRSSTAGQTTWFNQICLHHPSMLPASYRAAMASAFKTYGFPRNVTFADGSAIDDATVATIAHVLDSLAIDIQTRQGDVLMVNNLRFAHARSPYRGDRVIRVAMGDPCDVDSILQGMQ